MTNSHDSAEGAFGLDARDAQRLRQAVPELDDWPRSWHVEPADIAVGEQIVQVLTPFGLHLQDQGQARGTVSRHRDILWTSTLTKSGPSLARANSLGAGSRAGCPRQPGEANP